MLPCPLTLAILEAIGLKGQPIRSLTLRMNVGDYTTAEAEFLVVGPGELSGFEIKRYLITAREVGLDDMPQDTAVAPVESVEIPSESKQLECPIPADQVAGTFTVDEFETTTLESGYRTFLPVRAGQLEDADEGHRRWRDSLKGLEFGTRTVGQIREEYGLPPLVLGEEDDEDLESMSLEERSGVGTLDVWDRITIKAGSILERLYRAFPRRK